MDDEQTITSFLEEKADTPNESVSDEEVIEEFTTEESKDGGNKAAGEKASKESGKNKGGTSEERDEEETRKSQVRQAVQLTEKVSQFLNDGKSKAMTLPTPGGVGMLLIAIFVLLWTLVPTKSGFTRMQLLWMVLHDQVVLEGAQYPTEAQSNFSVPTTAFTQPVVTNPVSLQIAALTGIAPPVMGGGPLFGLTDFSQEPL